jgi:hypothetical protein
MVDGGDNEACIGQRRSRIAMSGEPAARAVRHDDERQPLAGDRTVPGGDDHGLAKPYVMRRLSAGRPYSPRQRGTVCIGGNVDEPQARSFGLG